MNDAGSSQQTSLATYAGFISYSQKDKTWARRIHRALEAYRLPTGVPEAVTPKKRLGRFFRDDDELAGAPSLGSALEDAIDDSAALIVICSPNSAKSKWVDAEIRRFKSRGPAAKVFAIIVDGRPDATSDDEQCFPPSLLFRVDADGQLTDEPDEPLAPDVSKDSFPRLITRVVAGLIGVDFDALWQRERRRRRRRTVLSSLALAFLAAASVAGYVLIDRANTSELIARAEQRATEAQIALDEGRTEDALLGLAEAVPENLSAPDRPIVPAALTALRRAMSDNLSLGTVARFDEPIRALRQNANGEIVAFLDSGAFHVIDATSGERRLDHPAAPRYRPLGDAGLAVTHSNAERQQEDGTWTIDSRLTIFDTSRGAITGALTLSGADWWLTDTVDANGTRVLAESVASNSDPEAKYAVFDIAPDGASSSAASPAAVLRTALIDTTEFVRTGFATRDMVWMSWGQAQKPLVLWNIATGDVTQLVAEGSELACPAEIDPARRDSVTLSPDSKWIAHARPVNEADWCVQLWSAETGQRLRTGIIRDVDAAGVLPLSDTTTLLPKAGMSWGSTAQIRSTSDMMREFPGCEAVPIAILSMTPTTDSWLTDVESQVSACATGSNVDLYAGPDYQKRGRLTGHSATVRTVVIDGAARRVWTGGDDGTLRMWSLPDARGFAAGLQSASPPVTDGTRVAAIFQSPETGLILQSFLSDGTAASPPIPFSVAPVPEGESEPWRNVAPALFADGQTIGIAEAFDCGFLACPEGFSNRLTLWRASDGERIAQLDNVRAAASSKAQPISFAADDRHAIVEMADGSLQIIDLLSGDLRRRLIPPDGSFYTDVAFAQGAIWITQADHLTEPENRSITLLRMADVTASALEDIDSRQAQGATIFTGPNTGALAVAYSYTHAADLAASILILGQDGARTDSPDLPGTVQHISFVETGEAALRIAVFMGELAAPVIFDTVSQSLLPFAPDQPGSLWDIWRADDPLGRAVVSVEDEVLTILPFTENALCPSLTTSAAAFAAFSRDGTKLALGADSGVQIVDLQTCQLERVIETDLTGLTPFTFTNDGTLWVREYKGAFRVIPPPPPDAELNAALRLILRSARARSSAPGE